MPRSKRAVRRRRRVCKLCSVEFYAVRDDARYCGPKCRKKINRAMQLVARATGVDPALKNEGRVQCAECGTRRDGRRSQCPICGSFNVLRLTAAKSSGVTAGA